MITLHKSGSFDWPEARKRVESYRTLPSEVRAEKLREEVRRAEESILSVTGDPLESSYWESLRDKANAELVSDQLRIRYLALSELFEMHCSDAEVAAVERQNARMLEYTEQMFGRTGRMFRYMLDMPREDRGEEIEVEGSLRYWEDGEVLQMPDDAFYGSDFGRMIPIISGYDSECSGDLPIIDCSPSCCDFDMKKSSMDGKALGLEDFLDDGQSWAEGPLRHPKLDHIVFCYASHAVITHKPYSIPDFIRLGLFEVRVEVKSQDFRQAGQDKNAPEAADQRTVSDKPASAGYFGAISEKVVKSICSDMRAFLQGRGFGDNILCKDGKLIASAATVALPVSELKKKLMTMGFKRWQVVSTEHENQVRVVILYADVAENIRTIIAEMKSMGWDKVSISEPAAIHGVKCRTMDFEPSSSNQRQ